MPLPCQAAQRLTRQMVGSQTKIDLWAGEDISSCFASAALSISFLALGLGPKRWQPLDLLSISLGRRGCLAAGSRKLSLQQATKEHLRTQTVCWLCMVAAAPCRRQAGLQQTKGAEYLSTSGRRCHSSGQGAQLARQVNMSQVQSHSRGSQKQRLIIPSRICDAHLLFFQHCWRLDVRALHMVLQGTLDV